MDIVCNFDNTYVRYASVMLVSLFENNLNEEINVHVLYKNLIEENQHKLSTLVQKYQGKHIHFYRINPDRIMTFPIDGNPYITMDAYLRLFMAEVIPQEVDKVLYLDCDLIVDGSLRDLWNTDVSDVALASVEDFNCRSESNYVRLCYSQTDNYFNSGVLLVNLSYLREIDFTQKAVDYISKYPERVKFSDQDVLNALLHDRKKLLPYRYNVQDMFLRRKQKNRTQAEKDLLRRECAHPVIIHFSGCRKPWRCDGHNPYNKLWYKYQDMTPWASQRPRMPFWYRWRKRLDAVLEFLYLRQRKYVSVR